MFKYKDNNGNWIELPELKDGKIKEENMPSNIPTLGSDGKIPTSQLPIYDGTVV